jgi:hypothetical protein
MHINSIADSTMLCLGFILREEENYKKRSGSFGNETFYAELYYIPKKQTPLNN